VRATVASDPTSSSAWHFAKFALSQKMDICPGLGASGTVKKTEKAAGNSIQ
jgi:hypothetical protein